MESLSDEAGRYAKAAATRGARIKFYDLIEHLPEDERISMVGYMFTTL